MKDIDLSGRPHAVRLEPINGKTWVCTDIHGCSETFGKLIEVTELRKQDRLLILGDLIRKGPDSIGVLQRVKKLKDSGYNVQLLKGNHEGIFLRGSMLKASFGFKLEDAPQWIMDLFTDLPLFFYDENFLFVHAGFDFSRPDPYDRNDKLIWIRSFEVKPENTGGRRVVHGHSPTSLERIQKAVKEKLFKIPLDNGCIYSGTERFGTLSAFCPDDFTLISIPYCEEKEGKKYRSRDY